MLSDHCLPPELEPPETTEGRIDTVAYRAARWSPAALAAAVEHLAGLGVAALSRISEEKLLEAWSATVEAFLDPSSPERQELEAALVSSCRLTPPALDAGLRAVLGGVRRTPAAELVAASGAAPASRPVAVILASNLPALAVQPLLPALARRRAVLLKSPSAEPFFAPAFTAALGRRLPTLAAGLAAVTWSGGERCLEEPVLAGCDPILAYGEAETMEDLRRRSRGRLVAHGPKTSLAVVGSDADPAVVARGLARDIALFDQRGCLSVAGVYTDSEANTLADVLAHELEKLAERWPPWPLEPSLLAALQQVRAEAELRALCVPPLPLEAGTVVVEPEPHFRPTPGGRLVRIHPVEDLARLPSLLGPWQDGLQGAALAGAAAWALAPALQRLGVSRCTAPGELQSPDATWHNGGVSPLAVLG